MLREILSTFIRAPMGTEARCPVRRRVHGVGAPILVTVIGRQFDTRAGSSDLAIRSCVMVLLTRPAVGTPHGRSRLEDGGGHLLSARSVDAAAGQLVDALIFEAPNRRVVNVHTLIAVGINAAGYRQILGAALTA